MNILSFIAGLGAGTFIATMSLITWMKIMSRTSSKWNKETLDLMKERNDIAREQLILAQLKRDN